MSYNNAFNPMLIQKPAYDVTNIRRPDPNQVVGNIEKRLIIDSRDRDYKLYPKPSNYVIKLNEDFKNITSIELVRASIPQSRHLINESNNKFTLAETGINVGATYEEVNTAYGVEETITICPGDYSITGLATEIETQLCRNQNLKSNYCVNINTTTGKIYIRSDLRNGGFHLKLCGPTILDNTNTGYKRLYPCNSIGKVLGYLPNDYLYGCGTVTFSDEIDADKIIMLGKILEGMCLSLTGLGFLKVSGTNTQFTCDFSCYDFLRIVNTTNNRTIRFLILSITDDTTMYVIGHELKVAPVVGDFTPTLTQDPITNGMSCLVDNNPNLAYWENYPAAVPPTGPLINLRKCNGTCNENICAGLSVGITINTAWIVANIGTGPFKFYKGTHYAENKYDLFYDKYIILDIPELHRMRSKATPIMDSFTVLPLSSCPNDNIIFNIANAPTSPEAKYFTPPLGRLIKFTIKFVTYDGDEYDFSGREHFLDLRINMLNQQGKYLNI